MIESRRTVMLVDDHAVVREGYRAVLEKQPGLKVIAEAGDGAEAYRLFKEKRPDLVVMDLTMPGIGGGGGVRPNPPWGPHAPILGFTLHPKTPFSGQAIPARAPRHFSQN